ncbi:MAG TPA: VWA domain-containing protein [Pyrinomonadaceae bacterium]
MQKPPNPRPLSTRLCSFAISLLLLAAPLVIQSQSGRQKDPKNANANANRSGRSGSSSIADPYNKGTDEADEVVRVSSNLVPVPATVVDSRGVAITNLKVEDFELRIDGQLAQINEISRSETPVHIAMLFDNSGSLSAMREFEKHAATRFFQNVLRPVDQAAVYSISTNAELVQPMTNDARLLQQTIEGFGKPEGSTSLYDGIFAALVYLKPYRGRQVIVIVSDGRDTTSRIDHDFDATRQRLLSDECQIYVVQTGLYDNANVRDLAAERRMEEFAAQTGGAVYVPKTVDDLDAAFSQIAADLAQQYILNYYPSEDKRDGRYHSIAVRVKSRTPLRIRARKGFQVKKRA